MIRRLERIKARADAGDDDDLKWCVKEIFELKRQLAERNRKIDQLKNQDAQQ